MICASLALTKDRWWLMPDLIESLAESLEQDPLVHYFETAFRSYPEVLLKDMTLEAVGPGQAGEV